MLVKLCPLMGTFMSCDVHGTLNLIGITVMVGGCVTFLLCSFMAISQSNAKRVLAYSTVANLGLVAACAGVGTPRQAVWAAIFLLVFHAAGQESLLFLCVGTAEHHIGSARHRGHGRRWSTRMPRLALLHGPGHHAACSSPPSACSSPSGRALVRLRPTPDQVAPHPRHDGLRLGAATFMFWAKWLGKLLRQRPAGHDNVEQTVHKQRVVRSLVADRGARSCSGCAVHPAAHLRRVRREPYIVSVTGTSWAGRPPPTTLVASGHRCGGGPRGRGGPRRRRPR